MPKTPDNFLRSPAILKPVVDEDLFVRLEYASLRYYMDDSCQKLHRTEGPAVIHNNGTVEYWNRGQLHRVEGPAIETKMGSEVYYLFGRRLTHEKWIYTKLKYNLDKQPENSVIKVHENNGDTKGRN